MAITEPDTDRRATQPVGRSSRKEGRGEEKTEGGRWACGLGYLQGKEGAISYLR
jgi:hypothetical protein